MAALFICTWPAGCEDPESLCFDWFVAEEVETSWFLSFKFVSFIPAWLLGLDDVLRASVSTLLISLSNSCCCIFDLICLYGGSLDEEGWFLSA